MYRHKTAMEDILKTVHKYDRDNIEEPEIATLAQQTEKVLAVWARIFKELDRHVTFVESGEILAD